MKNKCKTLGIIAAAAVLSAPMAMAQDTLTVAS